MDYFFAQIEERENPRFKGKPVVVGADPKKGKGRGVVSTANYEARKYGIHSALPISKAYKLYPDAIFLPVNMFLYAEVSKRVMEVIKKYSPQWEISGLDEAYLDISFVGSFEKAEGLAKKLKAEILKKEKLTATVGIGPNKMVAKIAAAQVKPDGLLVIKPDEVRKLLFPLDVQEVPGIGLKTAAKLTELGVTKIKELQELPKEKLIETFGKAGEWFYHSARGIDDSLVSSEEIVKSIGREYTFEKDTRDPEIIFETFEGLLKEVYQEVVENKFSFKTITVVCRFSGFETHTKAKTFLTSTNDLLVLRKEAKRLLLRFLLENPKPLRLVGLRIKLC